MQIVEVGDIKIGEGNPLVLIAGPCVIETEDIVMQTAETIKKITEKLKIPFIFKSSYLKDNRSSASSYQGPGLDKGLKILQKVKDTFDVPLLSDIHNAHEAEACAEVLDIVQIPAFLSMQTSLLQAVAKSGAVVNIKKGQFLAGSDLSASINKIKDAGSERILLTERGSMFGYGNLVVDMRSLKVMRELGYPVIMDSTHALKKYGVRNNDKSGWAKEFIFGLSRAAVAMGVDGFFIETHPDCDSALCDADSMLPLNRLEELLRQLKEIDALIKPNLKNDDVGMY
jgi:2-dehydro-3-deoxyphosphooctonate aldolase (KDO 8-P synthase)